MPNFSAACDYVRTTAFLFTLNAGTAPLKVKVAVVVVVLDRPMVAGAQDNPIDGILSPSAALVVASTNGAKALVLSVELVVGAGCDATSRAPNGFSGPVLGARRGPGSCGRVPTLTTAPP